MRRLLTRTAATAALVALPLTACGGGSSTATSSVSGADVTVHAKDTLTFDASQYTAKAGDLTFAYVDDGTLTHTLLIDGHDGFKLEVTGKGNQQTGKVNLPAGTYTIFCDIPGHRQGGMQAKLVVS
jgi:plastocyanin